MATCAASHTTTTLWLGTLHGQWTKSPLQQISRYGHRDTQDAGAAAGGSALDRTAAGSSATGSNLLATVPGGL
jgi:hypothetical protein